MPTVADVALAAGVSPMTVSRVINGEGHVLPATREKVRRAIAALGYVPNAAARSLAGGKQRRIALLYDNPSAAYLSEVLVGGLAASARGDAQIVVEHATRSETAAEVVRRLVNHRVDAVLLPPPLCEDPALLTALAGAPLPAAQIAPGGPAPTADAVTIAEEAAAYAMTAHLVTLGHRRIGFILGSSQQDASGLRRDGYLRALREAGLPIEPTLIRPGDFTYRSGLSAAEALLALPDPPSAIFASNDDMAAAAIACAHRRLLDVPRDLTVCGFDDTIMATTIWPELTTIRQPISEMAMLAAQMLIDRLGARGPEPSAPVRHERLAFRLVRRASDGPPRD